jgi:hypothetical protein
MIVSYTRQLAVGVVLLAVLAGCGQGSGLPGTAVANGVVAAAAKRPTQAAQRLPEPTAAKPMPRGYAARESSRVSRRVLNDYAQMLRDWNRAYSDYERDNIEERMLRVLREGLKEVQEVTSREGHDADDRRAYVLANYGLNNYERLYRDWESTYNADNRRRIVNAMLQNLVDTHERIRDNA